MVAKGATPVFYVAKDAPYLLSPETLAGRFVDMASRFQDFFSRMAFVSNHPKELFGSDLRELENAWHFMLHQVLPYIKVFDSGTPDDAVDNYYMEREWIVVGGVKFEIEDVSRVIIPRDYTREFRQRLPEYHGEVSFTDG